MIAPARALWLVLAGASIAACAQTPPLRETDPSMSSILGASDKSPPAVAPIERDGVRYEQDVERQRRDDASRGGWLVARDAATGHKLWEARVYDNPVDPMSPVDMPAIWFRRMAFVDGTDTVAIETEGGGLYEVDVRTHAVRKTGGPSIGVPQAKPDNRPSFD